MWAGISVIIGIRLIVLLINHRFHRYHVSKSDHYPIDSQVSVKTENRKSVTQLTSETDAKIVSTNLSVSPKTGKITSPSGVVELESYQRSKTAKTIKKTPPGQDVVDE